MNEEKQIPISDGEEASLENEDTLQSEEIEADADSNPGPEGGSGAEGQPRAEAATAQGAEEPQDEVVQDDDGSDVASSEAVPVELAAVPSAEDKVQQLEEKLAAMHDRLLRTAAELDNVRKRSRREIEEAAVKGRSDVLREILPVMDSIDLALSSADPEGSAAAIVEGVGMVRRQFFSATERFKLIAVETAGKAFDPNFHEAVAQIPSPDFAAGQIVEEMRKGYVLGDRLLRAAMVVVSAGVPKPEVEAPAQSEQDENTEAEGHGVEEMVDQPGEAFEASSGNADDTADLADDTADLADDTAELAEKTAASGDGDG